MSVASQSPPNKSNFEPAQNICITDQNISDFSKQQVRPEKKVDKLDAYYRNLSQSQLQKKLAFRQATTKVDKIKIKYDYKKEDPFTEFSSLRNSQEKPSTSSLQRLSIVQNPDSKLAAR